MSIVPIRTQCKYNNIFVNKASFIEEIIYYFLLLFKY